MEFKFTLKVAKKEYKEPIDRSFIGIKSTCTISAKKWLKRNNLGFMPCRGMSQFVDGIFCDFYIIYGPQTTIFRMKTQKLRWLITQDDTVPSYGIEAL